MFKVKIATIAIVIGAVLLAALSSLLPVPHIGNSLQTVVDEQTFHSTLAGFAVSITMGVGSALLFLMGLRGFSGAFRRTYYFICAGFIAQAMGGIVYLYSLYNGTGKSDISILIAEIPLVIGIIVVHVGYIRYARLLRISSWLMQPVIIGVLYAALMTIVWLLPHRTDTGTHNEFLFDLAHALQAVEIVTYCLVAALVIRIRSTVGRTYSRSLLWFIWGMVTAVPATLALFVEDYSALGGIDLGSLSLLFIVNSILTLISVYAFNKLSRLTPVHEVHNIALLDSVLFLSSLVSNPNEVDPILDKVRIITSSHTGDTPLSTTETSDLRNVYKQLQDYLLTKEQLRSFDRKGLNELVQERFNWMPAETS